VRHKRDQRPTAPAKYLRYRPEEWPGGWGEWVREREAWNARQPKILLAGDSPAGPWSYLAGPLGDKTDLMRARREARLTAFTDVDSG
jgi:hypothetical protein